MFLNLALTLAVAVVPLRAPESESRNNVRFPLLQSLHLVGMLPLSLQLTGYLTLALHLVGFLKMGEVLTLTL